MNLSIQTSQDNDAARLLVTGEVDVSNASQLRDAADAALAEAPSQLVVDLSDVAYIDSTGIGVLVGAATRADEQGVAFELASPQPNVRRVLSLLGVDKALKLGE